MKREEIDWVHAYTLFEVQSGNAISLLRKRSLVAKFALLIVIRVIWI